MTQEVLPDDLLAQRRRWVEAQRRCRARRRGDLPPVTVIADDIYAHGIMVGECLEWQRAHLPRGYGRFRLNGKVQSAHRHSLELKLGRPLKPGMKSCHTCDNPPCILQEHLFEGTQQDNVDDMEDKGRSWWFAAVQSTRKLEAA